MIRKLTVLFFACFVCFSSFAQSISEEESLVREALWNYINGRNTGKPELLHKAFHPAADLRHVKADTLRIWHSKDYIGGVKPGYQHNCVARIVYVNIMSGAAQAKIELEYPNWKYADYLNLLKIDGKWQIAVKTFGGAATNSKRVLFVITSHEQMGNTGNKTGLHLGEVSHVYKPIHDAGFEIDFVSPKGGSTYMYGANMNDSLSLWMMQEPTAYYKLTHALTPDQIDPSRYAAIYYVGGHGTMWDLPNNDDINSITKTIYENEGVVAAVCHGPSGLVNVKLDNGKYLVDGKKVTAFTDSEERAAQQEKVVPFMLESKLKERGAVFSGADNWQKNVVVDGKLITGQNPASAYELAQEIIKQLQE
ncbi:MAG: nuclear transport factor 2 family protein [Bacteroidota bacterium]